MTQTRDLIKKMADFFTGKEFYEKGEEARLELSPDDVRCMCEIIKALPPVKPQEPKTGHWIEDTNGIYSDNHDTWECSECGHAQILNEGTPKENKYYFCPHCGARMVEPRKGARNEADN